MTQINEFKCDSCKTRAPAKWNGEHFLMPHEWVELFDRDVHSVGHLCNVCSSTLWHLNLRSTKVGRQQEKKAGG